MSSGACAFKVALLHVHDCVPNSSALQQDIPHLVRVHAHLWSAISRSDGCEYHSVIDIVQLDNWCNVAALAQSQSTRASMYSSDSTTPVKLHKQASKQRTHMPQHLEYSTQLHLQASGWLDTAVTHTAQYAYNVMEALRLSFALLWAVSR
jgi:hypothetical protein